MTRMNANRKAKSKRDRLGFAAVCDTLIKKCLRRVAQLSACSHSSKSEWVRSNSALRLEG